MEIDKAMELIGIQNISEITEDKVKSLFRSKIRKVHPDLGGSDKDAKELIKAYETLIESSKKLEASIKINSNKRDTVVIKLEELISIYDGNTIVVSKYGTTETTELNRSNLQSNRILLLVQSELTFNGVNITVDDYVIYNSKDVYELSIDINNDKVEIGDKVVLGIGGHEVDLALVSKRLMVTVRLRYNVTIKVRLSVNNI